MFDSIINHDLCNGGNHITPEQIIRSVIATLEFEGFEVTDKTKELLRKVANKEATPEELIKEIINEHKLE